MSKNYWLKLRHDTLSVPHLARLRDRLWRRYIEMMIFASMTEKDGELPKADDMAWLLHCDVEQLETELAELAAAGLLSIIDGRYHVSTFKDTQSPSKHAQYMKGWREKKKESQETGKIEIKR
jgi:hypothetical protein